VSKKEFKSKDVPEEGFSRFMEFIKARESIRIMRAIGRPKEEWTADPIFKAYSFTNVHRFYDRTTQFFYRYYTENRKAKPEVQLLNCAINRWFGSVDFVSYLGWQSEFSRYELDRAARYCKKKGLNTFTGAYIVPNAGINKPKVDVAIQILGGLNKKLKEVVKIAKSTNSWEHCYEFVHQECLGYGGTGFMAKEMFQDALLCPVLENAHDKTTWTPVGPGARRGLNRIYGRPYREKISPTQAIPECLALHRMAEKKWDRFREAMSEKVTALDKPVLPLTAHDVQFQLCEFDKYERVMHNQGRPRKKFRSES
jgi:hypothetical protein